MDDFLWFFQITYRREFIDGVSKLCFLHDRVSSETLDLISGLPMDDEGYASSWNALVSHCKNCRRLVGTHVAEFSVVQAMNLESSI